LELQDVAWSNQVYASGDFFGPISSSIDLLGGSYLVSTFEINLFSPGSYFITYVVQSTIALKLNSIRLSSAQFLYNCFVSSETSNLGSSGGGHVDIWGQVITTSGSGAYITFPQGTAALALAFGGNWISGHWNCSQLTVQYVYWI